ncbi:hypothetical protein RCC89_08940 [Cytophagaceae bacterium ABcell3]|nr:hypothetical protein RCC89_08940 [Cytophagaceae bacterium ABcell3]
MILKKKKRKINGQVVFKYKNSSLYKVDEKTYVFDYLSGDVLGPILKKKKWFLDSFGSENFIHCFNKSLAYINFSPDVFFTQNIFSVNFLKGLGRQCVFDAWDNFLLFPENKVIEQDLKSSYQEFAHNGSVWVTNSKKNLAYYDKFYKPQKCYLVKNGVDVEVFNQKYTVPEHLNKLPRPLIGFGGKITHLFDYDLFNYVVSKHPDKSFVILGQVIDKQVFSKIKQAPNVFYLGDIHYSLYPSYVTNFDLGIVPYVTNQLEHGADSIKVYEYIAAGLGVVGTQGAGMNEMSKYIYVADNKNSFSNFINEALTNRKKECLDHFHTWASKTESIINIFDSVIKGTKIV